jgi:hypothetical protein
MRLSAHSIGVYGAELLRQPANLLVQGNTSKGVFLKHPFNKILFLSREQFKGPYSILLEQSLPDINMQESLWKIGDGTLTAGEELEIHLSDAEIWRAPERKTAAQKKPDGTLAGGVGRMAWNAGKTDNPVRWLACENEISDERWTAVFGAIQDHDRQGLKDALIRVCGYGRGLTPSGDDFILGMTLACQRYPEMSVGMKWLLDGEKVFDLSHRTTLISSNLVDAAANGQADERLISAFDGYMDGTMNAGDVYGILSTWGNSSGVDAFCGLVGYIRMEE